MMYFHKADYKLASWMEELASKATVKEAEQDVLSAYGMDSASSKSYSDEDSIVDWDEGKEEKQDESSPSTDSDKGKQVSDKVKGILNTPSEKKEEGGSETENKSENADVGRLKGEMEEIKDKLDELEGEEMLQKQIDEIKKKVDNIEIQDSSDLNNSINQSASTKIAHVKRELRRLGK